MATEARSATKVISTSVGTNATPGVRTSIVPERFNSTSQFEGVPVVRPELNSITEVTPSPHANSLAAAVISQ
jgi:hypothetical protein